MARIKTNETLNILHEYTTHMLFSNIKWILAIDMFAYQKNTKI